MRTRRAGLALLIFAVALTASTQARSRPNPVRPPNAHHKLDAWLKRADVSAKPSEKIRVIIRAAEGRRGTVAGLLAAEGHEVVGESDLVNAITANVPRGRLEGLAERSDVEHISVDAPVHGATVDNVGTYSTNMLGPTLGLPVANVTGSGIGVAIIDSGIVDNASLPIDAFFDFTRGGIKVKQSDAFGHGTHVAGMIKAKDDRPDTPYRSLAMGSKLIGLKVLGSDGSGYSSNVLSAIEFAIANKDKLGIDVINLSLGHPVFESATTDPLVIAVERAVAAGIVVVVAAGNDGMNRDTGEIGYGGISSPGNAPSAITVGAVDTKNTQTRGDDEVAAFSSRGPTWYDGYAKPDVVAPGRHVVSFMAKNSYLYGHYPDWRRDVATRTYMALSGTSMAAAVASGIVADVIEASQDANGGRRPTPNTVKAILEYTAQSLANTDALTQGAGSINAAGAIALAKSIKTSVPEGDYWLTQSITPSTLLTNGEIIDWAQRLVWGDRIVWGTYIYGNEPAWALRIVWGNRLVWGNRIVWGTDESSVVWGDRLVWGTRIVWGTNVLAYDSGGALLYGDDIDWNNVTADRLVWGSLSEALGALSDDATAGWSPVF